MVDAETVGEMLRRNGFDVEVYEQLAMVKVHDPDDTAELYTRVNDWTEGTTDIRMTSADVFQVLLD